jgi:hypothetical protein
MTEAQWFKVFYAKFARLFGFGRNDANCIKIHLPLKRKEAKKRLKNLTEAHMEKHWWDLSLNEAPNRGEIIL